MQYSHFVTALNTQIATKADKDYAFRYRKRIDTGGITTANWETQPAGVYYTGANSFLGVASYSYIYKMNPTVASGGSFAISITSSSRHLMVWDPDQNKFVNL